MNWSAPMRPVEHAEHTLITAILEGIFPVGSALPGERDLAVQVGVTRPTLREVLQRLERDGWIIIQQGKATIVNDFWRNGGLNILSGIVQHSETLPPGFVENLLNVRLDFAPTYTCLAIQKAREEVQTLLEQLHQLEDTPDAYAAFDWQIQRCLTVSSGNPIYALIFNSFSPFYEKLARLYFATPVARQASLLYYRELLDAVQRCDLQKAEEVTRRVMQASVELWRNVQEGSNS